jgi:hypothetical protein
VKAEITFFEFSNINIKMFSFFQNFFGGNDSESKISPELEPELNEDGPKEIYPKVEYDSSNPNFQINVPLLTTKGKRLIIHENRKYLIKNILSERPNESSSRAHLICSNKNCDFSAYCTIQVNSISNECTNFVEKVGKFHSNGCHEIPNDIINEKARQQLLHGFSYEAIYNSLRNPRYTSEEYVALESFALFQSSESLRSATSRKKLKAEAPTPKDVKNIIIPENSIYMKDVYGNKFIHYNSSYDNGSIIILGNEKFIRLIFSASVVLIDGTFKSIPSIFKDIKGQLLCIHTIINGQVYTCVYCLLPNKKCDTYQKLFEALLGIADKYESNISWKKVYLYNYSFLHYFTY